MAAENGKSRKAQPGKAILALDGGGIRGVISVAILEKIEQLHRERLGAEMTLSERFDLIGGTSTGAIIATALALGLATADIKTLYFELAPRVFRRSRTRLAFIQTLFDEAALREEIFKVVGDRRLDTPDSAHGACRHHQAHGHRRRLAGLEQSGRQILGGPGGRVVHRQPQLPARRPGARLDRSAVLLQAAVHPDCRRRAAGPVH